MYMYAMLYFRVFLTCMHVLCVIATAYNPPVKNDFAPYTLCVFCSWRLRYLPICTNIAHVVGRCRYFNENKIRFSQILIEVFRFKLYFLQKRPKTYGIKYFALASAAIQLWFTCAQYVWAPGTIHMEWQNWTSHTNGPHMLRKTW